MRELATLQNQLEHHKRSLRDVDDSIKRLDVGQKERSDRSARDNNGNTTNQRSTVNSVVRQPASAYSSSSTNRTSSQVSRGNGSSSSSFNRNGQQHSSDADRERNHRSGGGGGGRGAPVESRYERTSNSRYHGETRHAERDSASGAGDGDPYSLKRRNSDDHRCATLLIKTFNSNNLIESIL